MLGIGERSSRYPDRYSKLCMDLSVVFVLIGGGEAFLSKGTILLPQRHVLTAPPRVIPIPKINLTPFEPKGNRRCF